MMRPNSAWSAVLLWVLVGPLLFAAEHFLLTDQPEAESEAAVEAEMLLAFQPAPGAAADQAARDAAAAEAARGTAGRATRSSARTSYARLSRAPNMFGDSFGNGGQLTENPVVFFVPIGGGNVVACPCGTGDRTDLPAAGGGVIKVAENNKPIPMDRVFFGYNGFQNALTVGQPVPRDVNANRYTLGFEKSLAEGLWSVNVVVPFTDSLALNSDAFSVSSNSFGNLAVFLKRLAYSDDELALSAGLGVSLPTGSDLSVQTHQFNPIRATNDTQNLTIHNEAVHLVPYVGLLAMPSDDWFYQGFVSLDFAANGNGVDLGTPASPVGTLTEQNLFHLDFSIGCWIMRNPDAYYLHGVAALAELHYTSTIQDTDSILFPTQPDVGTFINAELTNLANRTDVLNLTGGIQLQIGRLSNLRVAGVVPVRNQPDRQFDSEIQISFNRHF